MPRLRFSESPAVPRHGLSGACVCICVALVAGLSSGCGHTPPTVASSVLTIRSVQPSSGLAGVATPIAISGTAFTPDTILTMDGAVIATTFVNSTSLRATTPARGVGTVEVAVTNPDGTKSAIARGFEYLPPPPPAVTGLTPSIGSTGGGTGVQVFGSGFQPGIIASIDGVAQQTFYGTNSAIIMMTTPHAPGPVDIQVTNPDGSKAVLAGKYTFALPQSFDMNGTWVAYPDGSEEELFRFTVQNNALLSITCRASAPIVFPAPPQVANGEFSFSDTIGTLTGRIVAAAQVNGTINIAGCGSGVWYASK